MSGYRTTIQTLTLYDLATGKTLELTWADNRLSISCYPVHGGDEELILKLEDNDVEFLRLWLEEFVFTSKP